MDNNVEPILQAWEDFARTIEPPALTMDDRELREHARQMLHAFAADLRTLQSEHERANGDQSYVECIRRQDIYRDHASPSCWISFIRSRSQHQRGCSLSNGMSTDSLESGRYLSQVDASCTLKVLVVDDERDLADLAGELLSAYAVANRVAYSAEEGLRAIGQDSEINAVFSDIMMPRMNGLQMAMTIKDRYPEVKIILTSGFTPPEILVMHDAFYMFTPKPYKIETVIKIFTSDFKFRRSHS